MGILQCATLLCLLPWNALAQTTPSLSTENATIRAYANDFVLVSFNNSQSPVSLGTLNEMLETEISQTAAAHQSLAQSILSEQQRAMTAESSASSFDAGLSIAVSTLNAQYTSFVATQGSLSANLAAETSHSLAAEGSLALSVSSEQSRATAVEVSQTASINAEQLRAMAAEASIPVVALGLMSEQSRATLAESSIAASIASERSRALFSENSVATLASAAVAAELGRATGVESSLSSALTSERSRAQVSEASLATATSFAVTAEQTRALGAESSLSSALTFERSRAQASEASLATATSFAVAAEQTRATGAESSLSASIQTEQARALGAEASITSSANQAVLLEQSRARSAESNLASSISAETLRAQSVEQQISSATASLFSQTSAAVACLDQGMVPNAQGSCTYPVLSNLTIPVYSINQGNINQYCYAAQTNGVMLDTTFLAATGLSLCKRTNTNANSCGSIFINPGVAYSQITGWVVLYQYGSPDGFDSAYTQTGDSLSIWAGNTFVWTYPMGVCTQTSGSSCPTAGGYSAPASTNGQWQCGAGYTGPSSGWAVQLYNNPVFGTAAAFSFPVTSGTQIELRFCLDEAHTNEDIYLSQAQINVLPVPISTPFRNVFTMTQANIASVCSGGLPGGVAVDTGMGPNSLSLCRRVNNVASTGGCGSIFINTGSIFSEVTGWVTLYGDGTPDAFSSSVAGGVGDSVSIWLGNTLLWDYAVADTSVIGIGGNSACPIGGGVVAPSSLNGQWSCGSSDATTSWTGLTFYNVPLFGPTAGFAIPLPSPSGSQIEIRFCTDEAHSNEEIYMAAASISVR